MPDVETAELAYDNGRYSTAQTICDSIVNSVGFDSLGVDRLCRLALLYSRLAEHHGDEEANTAQAAHCFETALSVNADSTLMFMLTRFGAKCSVGAASMQCLDTVRKSAILYALIRGQMKMPLVMD